jgi:4-hydroxy-tetrahydrodipicolinate reductase
MADTLRIAVVGAGRMGQAIAARVAADPDLELAGLATRETDLDDLVAACDVVIDFSLPDGTEKLLGAVVEARKPLVCGVSGLSDAQLQRLAATAAHVPLVYDRNMSQGITVLDAVVREVGGALGAEFAVNIDEVHHVHKKDAPSGTALKLGEALASVRDKSAAAVEYSSERRGEVPGDHTVTFKSATERLSFSHSVTTRDVFADGALRAARWVAERDPGLYSMRDVLFDE